MAFITPILTAIGVSASTASTVGTVATVAATAASVAGTAYSAYSEHRAGEKESKARERAAEAKAAEGRALSERYAYEEQLHRDKIRRIIGEQKALYAKAGVDVSEGSPFLTMLQTQVEGEKEAELIRKEGKTAVEKSYGEARLEKMYGSMAKTSGNLGAASTFLTGLGRAGLNYYSTLR